MTGLSDDGHGQQLYAVMASPQSLAGTTEW